MQDPVKNNDEHAIRELVATWLAATKAGDLAGVLALIAEDAVFLAPGQPPMEGKAAFAEAQAGLAQVDFDAQSEIEEIRVLGDWAFLRTQLSIFLKPKKGGTPIRREGSTLSILRKERGAWRLVRDANMLAVVPQV